jgi:hypothetical protein
MTTTPPTLAQVLRDEAKHLAALMDRQPWQASLALAFLRMAERLDHYTPPAALEAPARDAGREGHEFEPGLNPKRCAHCGGLAESTKHTEPPPPAWDAEKFIDDFWKSKQWHAMPQSLTDLVKAAYTAGQRAAGVQVPEEMPEWFRKWMSKPFGGQGEDGPYQTAWQSLRSHLTQTREG